MASVGAGPVKEAEGTAKRGAVPRGLDSGANRRLSALSSGTNIQPRRWQMIGKTALSLVRSLPGLDDQSVINSILSQEPVDQAAYHEIGSRDRVVGFLRLPVMDSNPAETLWIIGVQAARAYPADMAVPGGLPQEMDLH